MNYKTYETAEFVGRGHPDKIADLVSDLVCDYVKRLNKSNHRCAVETLIKNNLITLYGETFPELQPIDYHNLKIIIESRLREFGKHFSNSLIFNFKISKQSAQIAQNVNKEELGAGDQGVVVGYANSNPKTNQHSVPFYLSKKIIDLVYELNKKNKLLKQNLFKDIKSQVSVVHQNNKTKIKRVILSIHHSKKLNFEEFKNEVKRELDNYLLTNFKDYYNKDIKYDINSGGAWTYGGTFADTGVTGRKIIVDTFGPSVAHGGGAFSGKDFTKQDRTGALVGRYIAKFISKLEGINETTVHLAFGMGINKPVTLNLNIKPEQDLYKNNSINSVNNYISTIKKTVINYFSDWKVQRWQKFLKIDKVKYSELTHNPFFNNSFVWEKAENKELYNLILKNTEGILNG